MGAWGPGLFSSDITCDVRDSYIERLALGQSDAEAEEKTIIEYQEESEEKWLALAVVEWKKGRLSECVKSKGVAYINDTSSLSPSLHSPTTCVIFHIVFFRAFRRLVYTF